jgi:hypothetical protein
MKEIRLATNRKKAEVQTRGFRTVNIRELVVYQSGLDKKCVVFVGVGIKGGWNKCLKIEKQTLLDLADEIRRERRI